MTLTLGFLASGRGSNMQAILQACSDGRLAALPGVVISNNADSGALQIARTSGIPAFHLSNHTHASAEALDQAITTTLQKHNVDLVILAGYMKRVGPNLLTHYKNRILNIHPSLLPKFGGQGMYGQHVHAAVLAAGEKVTGATVHLVDADYDQGLILAQETVNVKTDDNATTLAARVLPVEHLLYVRVIGAICNGDIKLP